MPLGFSSIYSPYMILLPGLDTRRTTSKLLIIAITPFFEIYYKKAQAYRLGQKPEEFTDFGRLTKRHVLQLDWGTEPKNVILEARRYQACLEAVPDRTKAEVAEILGISRARVTPYRIKTNLRLSPFSAKS